MKQITFINLTALLFIIGGFTCMAQLRVDSIGNVGIGTTSTESQLSVGGNVKLRVRDSLSINDCFECPVGATLNIETIK